MPPPDPHRDPEPSGGDDAPGDREEDVVADGEGQANSECDQRHHQMSPPHPGRLGGPGPVGKTNPLPLGWSRRLLGRRRLGDGDGAAPGAACTSHGTGTQRGFPLLTHDSSLSPLAAGPTVEADPTATGPV